MQQDMLKNKIENLPTCLVPISKITLFRQGNYNLLSLNQNIVQKNIEGLKKRKQVCNKIKNMKIVKRLVQQSSLLLRSFVRQNQKCTLNREERKTDKPLLNIRHHAKGLDYVKITNLLSNQKRPPNSKSTNKENHHSSLNIDTYKINKTKQIRQYSIQAGNEWSAALMRIRNRVNIQKINKNCCNIIINRLDTDQIRSSKMKQPRKSVRRYNRNGDNRYNDFFTERLRCPLIQTIVKFQEKPSRNLNPWSHSEIPTEQIGNYSINGCE